jgi:hypothetical protein
VRSLARHRSTRGFAALLAVVALAGQLASFAHLVVVRHVTCAEHGEMIEVGSAATSAAVTPHETPPAMRAAASPSAAHAHEHCLISPMRRDRIAATALTSADPARVDTSATTAVAGDRAVAPPIAAIVLAPKSSPPIA